MKGFKEQVTESLKEIKLIIAEAKVLFRKVTPMKVIFLGPERNQHLELFEEAHLFSVPRPGDFLRVTNDEFAMRGTVRFIEWHYELDRKKRLNSKAVIVMIFLDGVVMTPFEILTERLTNEQKD